jgi:hypothetical protein
MNEPPRALMPRPPTQLARPVPDRRRLGLILWQVVTSVEAKPPPPPSVRPDLATMPLLVRLYECLRLYLLDLEQALSPGGQLRGLGRWACRVAVAAGILALCLAAVLGCVAAVLAILVAITGQIVLILWNLLEAVLLVLALLALGALLLLAVRAVARAR